MTWDARQMIGQVQTRSLESFEFTPLGEAVRAFRGHRNESWRPASIKDALGVPAIQRAVSLISNTTGSLSVEGLRNGVAMNEPPRIVQRPDPFQTPREFYRDTAYYLATRGEAVWWIAARDGDGLPASLIVVPARELHIDENPRDRRFPIYTWGNGPARSRSTRYSPIANQTGDFVHVTYLKEPGDLRGQGPLQMCGAAISVTVEAQQWAANFFAGDTSSTELKSLVDIDKAEADILKAEWMANQEANLPRVTNPTVEWKDHTVDPASAQMTEARSHQDGEAARMFGIPGKLLEYAAPGSSLTYQNIAEVFTDFVRSCLSINYLEPIEQALSDLLPRTTAARFNVEGLLRADIKTRFEVYKGAVEIWGPDEGAQYARVGEGRSPGNIELQPVPFAFPQAIPASLPTRARAEIVPQQPHPADRLADAMFALAAREQPAPQVTVHSAPVTVEPAQVTFERGAIQVDAPEQMSMTRAIAELAERPAPNVTVDVAAPDMSGVAEAMAELANRPQPDINITTPEVRVEPTNVTVSVPEPKRRRIERDDNGRIVGLVDE